MLFESPCRGVVLLHCAYEASLPMRWDRAELRSRLQQCYATRNSDTDVRLRDVQQQRRSLPGDSWRWSWPYHSRRGWFNSAADCIIL